MDGEINMEEAMRICGELHLQIVERISAGPWSNERVVGAFYALVSAAVLLSGRQHNWDKEAVTESMVAATNRAIEELREWGEAAQELRQRNG